MFIDAPYLSLAADLRHRELLADAENFRLAKLARAARRLARAPQRPAEPRPPEVRPPARSADREIDADRRSLVPR
jgi:hypothetical protein